jgi:hypothetical protein
VALARGQVASVRNGRAEATKLEVALRHHAAQLRSHLARFVALMRAPAVCSLGGDPGDHAECHDRAPAPCSTGARDRGNGGAAVAAAAVEAVMALEALRSALEAAPSQLNRALRDALADMVSSSAPQRAVWLGCVLVVSRLQDATTVAVGKVQRCATPCYVGRWDLLSVGGSNPADPYPHGERLPARTLLATYAVTRAAHVLRRARAEEGTEQRQQGHERVSCGVLFRWKPPTLSAPRDDRSQPDKPTTSPLPCIAEPLHAETPLAP